MESSIDIYYLNEVPTTEVIKMVTLFLDISEIRALFLTSDAEKFGFLGVLSNADFKAWLFQSINWLDLLYTDFRLTAENENVQLNHSVTQFEGLSELYDALKNALNHPALIGKTITSSYGFICGDLLYFNIETDKGFC